MASVRVDPTSNSYDMGRRFKCRRAPRHVPTLVASAKSSYEACSSPISSRSLSRWSSAVCENDVKLARVLGALGEQPERLADHMNSVSPPLDDPPKAVEGRGSTHHIGVPQPPAVGVLQHLSHFNPFHVIAHERRLHSSHRWPGIQILRDLKATAVADLMRKLNSELLLKPRVDIESPDLRGSACGFQDSCHVLDDARTLCGIRASSAGKPLFDAEGWCNMDMKILGRHACNRYCYNIHIYIYIYSNTI